MLRRAAAFALLPAVALAAGTAGTPPGEESAPRRPPIASADWQPQAGDVILRASDDLVGARIRTASGEHAVYSHVGLVVTDAGEPVVADVSPFGSGRVEFTNLQEFTTDGTITDLLVVRPREPVDAARLEREAQRLIAAGIEFDYGFDMADASQLYCAELAYHLLRAAGADVSSVPWTRMHVPLHGERNLIAPDAFARSPALQPVFRRVMPG
jgi:hypothetical protein